MASSKQPGPIGRLPLGALDQLPSTIGPFQNFATALPTGYYSGPRSSGPGKRKSAPGTREITVVGDFLNPWNDAKEEIDAIESGLWFPSTDDFIAVELNGRKKKGTKTTPIVGSGEAFIRHILDQPVGSIKRINILTHGNTYSIAFSGDIETTGAVSFTEELDIGTFEKLLLHGIIYRGRHVDWEEVERRFGRDAEIVIYACNAGLNEETLQDVANFFDVTVKGFDKELEYLYPPFPPGKKAVIKRKDITVEKIKNFHGLKPNVVKRPELKDPFE